MPPFPSRPAAIGLAVTLAAMLAVGFLPLFDGPGYESALAAGLLVPSAVAIVTALQVLAARPDPERALARGLANGAVFAAGAYATTLVHGLRTGFCDALAGSILFALGPGAGALLGGAWGAAAGLLAARRSGKRFARLGAVLLALAAPLAGILASVARFYTSPMVFAYDPFVGYFSGTLYDTVIDSSGLITYRAGTAATLAAAYVLALHLHRDDAGHIEPRWLGRPGLVVAGLAAATASAVITLSGSRLGHYQTAETIAETLGGSFSGERCDVIHPRTLRPDDVRRFTRDCDALVAVEEGWFGLAKGAGPARIRVYLFDSAAQKGALMGASGTQIAKPWRREIYIQAAGYPHPVVGHELAHVIAGSVARGPFRIAGSLGGLLPDPGLIEGAAVAASPPEGDLTPRDWAKAMKDLDLLPPLSRLFAFGFLAESSTTAYTASGAFVGYVHDRFGPAALAAWYGGEDLASVTGSSQGDLERAWHDDLDRVALPEAAFAQAKARFSRPAVFARRCPHTVDACAADAEGLAASGDSEGAIQKYDEARKLDPESPNLQVAQAIARESGGDRTAARAELERIVSSAKSPDPAVDRAEETLGDWALEEGDTRSAIARYEAVSARTVDEDRLRTLDVKIAAARDPHAREAIVALLIGHGSRAPDRVEAAELLRAWAERSPDDGLPWYLLARYFVGTGDLGEAAARLDRALGLRLDMPRVAAEARRLRAIVACGLGDSASAARARDTYLALPNTSSARRETLEGLVERCTPRAPE